MPQQPSSASRYTRLFVREPQWYEDRAQGLVSAHAAAVPAALAQIRDWHPRFAGWSDQQIERARFALPAARVVYARQHGFRTWPELLAAVAALDRDAADHPFLDAFEALRRWDRRALETLLREHPDLLDARGTNGNTLLNLAVSLAGSTCGSLPDDSRAALALLLSQGSAADVANDRGWTPLHQAAYANRADLVELLLAAGAAVDREAHGEGGTPLAVALFWGNREAAEALARVEVVPSNLRIAAGLGRIDLLSSFFTADGALDRDAGRGRGFYRPHSGFPVWRPFDDRQEILDEALVWAARSGRVEAMAFLVERGARLDSDPYRGTALGWAAWTGRLDAAAWLIDHGAEVNQRATFGGPGHGAGVTALHLAAQNGNLPMARLLCERGADPTLEDDLYHGSPASWAEHFGQAATLDYLRSELD
jgi:ankyrin repeat protein